MITVIIPVYNVEPYLRKCLDSVVEQVYRDLEILIIDDGSTDCSGAICEEYAQADERIRVFHTENCGVAAARNLGLDEAHGEWIGFIDGDDWVEPDMYEALLSKAKETGDDVVECGTFWEYPDRTVDRTRKELSMSGMNAIGALLHCELFNAVWNKLWKRHCFEHIRFPVGRACEDVATTYLAFAAANRVSTLTASKYHYLRRADSLSMKYEMANLAGSWLSHKERHDFIRNRLGATEERESMRLCVQAVARTWAHYCDCSAEEKRDYQGIIREMNAFIRQSVPLFGYRTWELILRIGVFLSHFQNALVFRLSWIMNRSMKRAKRFVRTKIIGR